MTYGKQNSFSRYSRNESITMSDWLTYSGNAMLIRIIRSWGTANWIKPVILNLRFVSPCIVSIIVTDDQKDATILVYLFNPNQLYVFQAMYSPIIRSTWLYLQLLILSTVITAGWFHGRSGTAVPPRPWQQPAAITVDNIEAVNTAKCSWWQANTSPETCRAD